MVVTNWLQWLDWSWRSNQEVRLLKWPTGHTLAHPQQQPWCWPRRSTYTNNWFGGLSSQPLCWTPDRAPAPVVSECTRFADNGVRSWHIIRTLEHVHILATPYMLMVMNLMYTPAWSPVYKAVPHQAATENTDPVVAIIWIQRIKICRNSAGTLTIICRTRKPVPQRL